MGMPTMEVRTRLAMCKVLAVQGGGDAQKQIAAALDRADALLHATGARAYEPMVLVGRAELADLVGDVAARERSLRRAFELFAEMGATGRAERVEKLLEREGRIS